MPKRATRSDDPMHGVDAVDAAFVERMAQDEYTYADIGKQMPDDGSER